MNTPIGPYMTEFSHIASHVSRALTEAYDRVNSAAGFAFHALPHLRIWEQTTATDAGNNRGPAHRLADAALVDTLPQQGTNVLVSSIISNLEKIAHIPGHLIKGILEDTAVIIETLSRAHLLSDDNRIELLGTTNAHPGPFVKVFAEQNFFTRDRTNELAERGLYYCGELTDGSHVFVRTHNGADEIFIGLRRFDFDTDISDIVERLMKDESPQHDVVSHAKRVTYQRELGACCETLEALRTPQLEVEHAL